MEKAEQAECKQQNGAAGVHWVDEPNVFASSRQESQTSANRHMDDGYENLTWENIVELDDAYSLGDNSPQAEARRTELIRTVFLYELVNSNMAYQRHMRLQQDREQEDASVLAQYHLDQSAQTRLARCWGNWRSSSLFQETYMTLTYAEHSILAKYINMVIIFAILWSTAMFCVETVPSIETSRHTDWMSITNYICLAIFTIEYVGRLLTCPRLFPFVTNAMNVIDFLAVFPSYIEIILTVTTAGGNGAGQSRIIRLIRLLRILRMLRLWSRFQNVRIIMEAVVASMDVLAMMFFLLIVILVSFSAIIYFIEFNSNPNLDSIPQTMYFLQTTLTTTGYGEIVPATWQGKAVTGLVMLTAIITLALPISVIGANFTNMWTDYKSMRSAAARSEKVWSNFRTLNDQVAQHKAVLEDVQQHFRRVQEALRTNIDALLDAGRQARLIYLMRVTQGKSPGWEHDFDQLKVLIAGMQHSLSEARQWWEHLEVATDLGHMTRAEEFVSKLDRMHMAYKNLRKWFEEGVYMAQEVKLLTDDIGVLKETLKGQKSQMRTVPKPHT